MTDHKQDREEVYFQTIGGAKALINIMSEQFQYPIDALGSGLIALATLAYGIGMSEQQLVEGIRAAYSDISAAKGDERAH